MKVVNFTFSCNFLWSAVNMDIGLRCGGLRWSAVIRQTAY